MKIYLNHTIPIFVILLLSACSTFNENLDDFSHETNFQQPLEEFETKLPVINITVDPTLFDDMYERHEEEIEIGAYFNLYRNQQLLISNELIELEVKGNYSAQFPLKSLGVKFDKRFDNTARTLIDPGKIVANHRLDHIKAIRLRNSGNDFKQTMIKDLAYTKLAIQANLNLDLAYGEPALVFINGDYLGLLNLRTESNTNGMASLYNVNKDDITMGQMQNPKLDYKDGDTDRLKDLEKAVENYNLNYIYANIDLTNFIDYTIFESYIANVDWPYTNVRFYAINNGKFRFVLFDLDSANAVYLRRSPKKVIESDKVNLISDLFLVLYKAESFKNQFWDRYHELMENGLLSSEKFEVIVNTQKELIEPYMPKQIKKYSFPESMIEWFAEVDNLTALFEKREEIVKKDLRNR